MRTNEYTAHKGCKLLRPPASASGRPQSNCGPISQAVRDAGDLKFKEFGFEEE